MPSSFSSIKLFAGTSHRELAELISRRLDIPLSPSDCVKRNSGEIVLDLKESVREADVYIIKCVPVVCPRRVSSRTERLASSTASADGAPTNVSLMETLIMAHACKIASAKRITAVVRPSHSSPEPRHVLTTAGVDAALSLREAGQEGQVEGAHHCQARREYARQLGRQSCYRASRPFEVGGAMRTVDAQTMDLHASQIQGFFDVPVDKCVAVGYSGVSMLTPGTQRAQRVRSQPRDAHRAHSFTPSRPWSSTSARPSTYAMPLSYHPMQAARSGALDRHGLGRTRAYSAVQRLIPRSQAGPGFRALPQGAEKGQRGLPDGPGRRGQGQNGHPD
jgi:hypothetical protein